MSQWYFKPGDYYQLDDISGFKIRASQSRKIPGGQTGGAIVDKKRWEPQQPQDFVRGFADDQTVPEARPRQQDRFTVTATFVTSYAPRLTNVLTVQDTVGFAVLDRISVMLDSGDPFYATIIRITGKELRITPVLPWSVGGNIGAPIENTVMDLGPSNLPPFLTNDAGAPITDEDGNLFSTNE